MTSKKLARKFHDTYERLAPKFGYETRRESAVDWKDVPDDNKKLMIAVADEILTWIFGRYNISTTQPQAAKKYKYNLFNHWLSCLNLLKHKKHNNGMRIAETRALKNYSEADLENCINNYNIVLGNSKMYWYNYMHTFESFFRKGVQKEPPYVKFLSESEPFNNFKRKDNFKNEPRKRNEGEFPEPDLKI